MSCRIGPLLGLGLLIVAAVVVAAPSSASTGWIAVAKSPAHEALDWGKGNTRADAEVAALQLCAQMQPVGDCYLLASGPLCAAVAWDISEPLNIAFGAIGDTPALALNAAVASAGPFANGPEVRCSYLERG
jgi:hypothetical protein